MLRQRLVGSLLDVVSTNLRHGREAIAIFEVGKARRHRRSADARVVASRVRVTGPAEPPAWNRLARPYDLDDAKGVLELLCRRLGLPVPTYRPLTDDPNLHPGRAASVSADSFLVGRVGEVHPGVVDALDLRTEHILVAEVAIAGLAGGQPSVPHRGDAVAPAIGRARPRRHRPDRPPRNGRGGRDPTLRWGVAPARRAVRCLPRAAVGCQPTRASPIG